MNKSQD
jgi:hypothetical protein